MGKYCTLFSIFFIYFFKCVLNMVIFKNVYIIKYQQYLLKTLNKIFGDNFLIFFIGIQCPKE